MAKGILIAAMDFSNVVEDEFNDWYDTEHVPERQPDELAAALDPVPVIELVTHTAVSLGRREVRTAFQLARR